jgi:hypothetical protein
VIAEVHTARGGQNSDRLYLAELRLQCQLATHAYSFLKKQKASIRQNGAENSNPRKSMALLCHGVGFVWAVTCISGLLYSAGRRGVARGLRLRRRLGLGYLPHTASPTIRHAPQLISERLHHLSTNYSDAGVEVLRYGEHETRGIALRSLDVRTLTIRFLDQSIQAEACHEEVRQIRRALAAHFKPPRR